MQFYLKAVTFFVLLTVFSEGEAIRCWTCSSDLDPRCHDPFNATIPLTGLGYALTDCNAQSSVGLNFYSGSANRAVCKKSKQLVGGQMTIIRACTWLSGDQVAGPCPVNSNTQIRSVFCETCEYEGCNSGYSLVAMPIVTVLAVVIGLLQH